MHVNMVCISVDNSGLCTYLHWADTTLLININYIASQEDEKEMR